MEITIHTGFMGDSNTINIDWYNENNVKQKSVIEINVKNQDKPRTLEILINGAKVAEIPNRE